ncbi:MAG: hypothetical protein IT293_20380 [Deltaproteobacteria bacterium]|nr:hypothetical protein [Deltaproteobacteria bacterium]
MPPEPPPFGARRRPRRPRAARAALAVLLACALAGCLSATPPKTPNQREAERRAPRIVVPPPVGERTPRPAADAPRLP